MSIKDTLVSLKDINTWNKHPWDKVSHTVLGLLFAAPVFYLSESALVATISGTYMLYGREQAQHEKHPTGGLIRSWFPWNWTKDGILDVAEPLVAMYAVLYLSQLWMM